MITAKRKQIVMTHIDCRYKYWIVISRDQNLYLLRSSQVGVVYDPSASYVIAVPSEQRTSSLRTGGNENNNRTSSRPREEPSAFARAALPLASPSGRCAPDVDAEPTCPPKNRGRKK